MATPSLTPVVFRRYRSGDIIALFPYQPGTNDPATCASYMHVGQHGSADPYGVMRDTKPAKPTEYAALKRELESEPFGYRFDVYKRNPRGAYVVRRLVITESRS